VDRPLKELKAFKRVNLKPGETRSATFTLDQNAMSFYDAAKKTWIAEPWIVRSLRRLFFQRYPGEGIVPVATVGSNLELWSGDLRWARKRTQ
jgi:hypothetical protein